MRKVVLGNELEVSAQGFGAMGVSAFYGSTDEKEAAATLLAALDTGITLIDTAEAYGPFENERFIGRTLAQTGRRDEIVLATKFGIEFDDDGRPVGPNGTAGYARRAVARSLRHLQTDHIDLLYLHRVDPATPVEESVAGMADLVRDGLVRRIGLSEVSAETLRRAYAVHPIAALQSEFSLFSPDLETSGIADVARELSVGLVAFSPLGRGFLTGQIRSVDDLNENDARRGLPRFQPAAIEANLRLVDQVRDFAGELDLTPAQIALAWVQSRGIVPIPGTRSRTRLAENAMAADLELTAEQLDALNSIVQDSVVGERDTPAGLSRMNA